MQAHYWQGKSHCRMAVWPSRWLPRRRGLLASTLLLGPLGSPSVGQGCERPRCTLCWNPAQSPMGARGLSAVVSCKAAPIARLTDLETC